MMPEFIQKPAISLSFVGFWRFLLIFCVVLISPIVAIDKAGASGEIKA